MSNFNEVIAESGLNVFFEQLAISIASTTPDITRQELDASLDDMVDSRLKRNRELVESPAGIDYMLDLLYEKIK